TSYERLFRAYSLPLELKEADKEGFLSVHIIALINPATLPGSTRIAISLSRMTRPNWPSVMQITGRPEAKYSPSLLGKEVSPNPRLRGRTSASAVSRSEEHTSELQSRFDLVCRLLLEKKKKNDIMKYILK